MYKDSLPMRKWTPTSLQETQRAALVLRHLAGPRLRESEVQRAVAAATRRIFGLLRAPLWTRTSYRECCLAKIALRYVVAGRLAGNDSVVQMVCEFLLVPCRACAPFTDVGVNRSHALAPLASIVRVLYAVDEFRETIEEIGAENPSSLSGRTCRALATVFQELDASEEDCAISLEAVRRSVPLLEELRQLFEDELEGEEGFNSLFMEFIEYLGHGAGRIWRCFLAERLISSWPCCGQGLMTLNTKEGPEATILSRRQIERQFLGTPRLQICLQCPHCGRAAPAPVPIFRMGDCRCFRIRMEHRGPFPAEFEAPPSWSVEGEARRFRLKAVVFDRASGGGSGTIVRSDATTWWLHSEADAQGQCLGWSAVAQHHHCVSSLFYEEDPP